MNRKIMLMIFLLTLFVSSVFANIEEVNYELTFKTKEEKNIIVVFDEKGLLEEQNNEMSKKSRMSASKFQKMNEEFNEDYKKDSKKLKEIIKEESNINSFSTRNNVEHEIKEIKNVFSGMTISNINEDTYDEIKKEFPNAQIFEDLPVEKLVSPITRDLLNISQIHAMQIDGTNLTGKGVTVAVLDTGIDPTHPDFGICEGFSGESKVDSYSSSISYNLESIHPYTNNYLNTQYINLSSNITSFVIHFVNFSIESGYDFLRVYDSNNSLIETISGVQTNYSSKIITGNSARLEFDTDSSIVGYGYVIDSVLIPNSSSIINCPKILDNYDYAYNDELPYDEDGHGTHVASTISSNNSNYNLKGIAPDSNLYIYQVLDDNGGGLTSDVISAIERSLDPNSDGNFSDKADIISLSLGWRVNSPNHILSLAIDNIAKNGVIPVVAAGNEGPDFEEIRSPGTSREAITVGATFKDFESYGGQTGVPNEIVDFSSRGPTDSGTIKPDIVAPGVHICAAKANGVSGNSCEGSSEHYAISGTSMATPIVSGVIALMKQKKAELTPKEVKAILKSTAKDLNESPVAQGWGMIQPLEAINSLHSSCIVEFNTSDISSYLLHSNAYSINASINCDNFSYATLTSTTLDSNLSKENNIVTLDNVSSQGVQTFNFNFPDFTPEDILLELNVYDSNSNIINKDMLYIKSTYEIGNILSTNITSCGVIVEAGNYFLSNNIFSNNNSNCIEIKANNININCNNYIVQRSHYGNYKAFNAKNLNNISIQNCKLSNYDEAIFVENNQNIKINNIEILGPSTDIILINNSRINLSNIFTSNESDKKLDFRIINNNNININRINNSDYIILRNNENSQIKKSIFRSSSMYYNKNLILVDSKIDSINLNECRDIDLINISDFNNKKYYLIGNEEILNSTFYSNSKTFLCEIENKSISNITVNNSHFEILSSENINISNIKFINTTFRLENTNFAKFQNISLSGNEFYYFGYIYSNNNFFENLTIVDAYILINERSDNLTFKNINVENIENGFYLNKIRNSTFENIKLENVNLIRLWDNIDLKLNKIQLVNINNVELKRNSNIHITNNNFSNFNMKGNFIIDKSGPFYFSKNIFSPLFRLLGIFYNFSENENNFNFTKDNLNFGNYWTDFNCLKAKKRGDYYVCTNPSKYIIQGNVVDNAPLIKSNIVTPYLETTNLINQTMNVSQKSIPIHLKFNNSKVSKVIVRNFDSLNQNRTYDLSSFIKNNSISTILPIRFGLNNLSIQYESIYGIQKESRFIININKTIIGTPSDRDDDNINDSIDTVFGNSSFVVSNINNLSFEINNSNNLSKIFNKTLNVTFKKKNKKLIEFKNNFTKNSINLSNIEIRESNESNNSQLIISGIELENQTTKTIYLDLTGNTTQFGSLCIKDAVISDFSEISDNCTGINETYIQSVPTTINQYTIEYENSSNTTIKIIGLIHSGVSQTCTENWQYSAWSSCSGGTQTRTATDSNSCGTTHSRETLSQSCTSSSSGGSSGGGGGGGGGSSSKSSSTTNNVVSQKNTIITTKTTTENKSKEESVESNIENIVIIQEDNSSETEFINSTQTSNENSFVKVNTEDINPELTLSSFVENKKVILVSSVLIVSLVLAGLIFFFISRRKN